MVDIKGLTVKKSENFSEWFTEIIQKAELADYSPVRGFMIIRPRAYALWENIQNQFNKVLREKGVLNAYFPLLIPDSFFKKEAEHAEGFAPELAYIEQKDDGVKLAIRPTSETIMYDSYSKWIRSYRDLPLKLNQWCNVVRWEVKQTKPFLRTREFLWQEGHCAFATENEAIENMNEMVRAYQEIAEGLLAIPVIVGSKSKMEKFAGAVTTLTTEAIMSDGKALQMGTSHNLGQNFAKAFNVMYKDKNEKDQYVWQTSWGFSTRLIGALIMVHGDDKGLVIPPKLASNKIVIVPILFEDSKDKVLAYCRNIASKLSEFGVFVDDREGYSAGWKFSEWELKGVPLRIEVGPKDLEKKQVVIVRRDNGFKEIISDKEIIKTVSSSLETMQKDMYLKARKNFDSKIDSARDVKQLIKKLDEGKMVKVFMVDDKEIEQKLKEQTGAASRIVEEEREEGVCIISGKKTKTIAYVARNY
ncbi:proline--tRNA ligase [Candidatus Pacearchaeota archaeon]|nr:proline--tRNA ligase [Candidatus Pacearchaeota archaeon]